MRRRAGDVHTRVQARQLSLLGRGSAALIALLLALGIAGPVHAANVDQKAGSHCDDPRPEICTRDYRPVCGLRDTGMRCIMSPCESSEWKTYGNACSACADSKVSHYMDGACEAEVGDRSLPGRAVRYRVDGAEYEGWYVDAGADGPLVLLLHDWDGLTAYEKRRAGMLAELGYSVFAADLFGAGVRPTEDQDKRQHTGALYADRDKLRRLLQGALQTAGSLGGNLGNAVAAGYCFGGAAVLELARTGTDMRGFVSFHGGLATPPGQDYSATDGPLLILHGSADTAIPLQDLARLGTELEQAGVPHELVSYSGAPHAFTVFGSSRYQADADRKSWQRFLQFLRETTR